MIGMQFFYMKHDFYAGQFTKTAFPLFDGFNEFVALWFISWFNKSAPLYRSLLVRDFEKTFNDTELIVPYKNNEVAVEYIEEFVRDLNQERLLELEAFLKEAGLDDCSLSNEEKDALRIVKGNKKLMRNFSIVEKFNVINSHNILKSDVLFGSGTTPYVTASEGNNSIVSYISYKPEMKEKGNSIMIGGKTLVITYQPYDFFSNDSHNLVLFINDEAGKNESAQLYMVASLYKSLGPKYSWGDSISNAKIQSDVFCLPVMDDGESIDYVFMETYINAVKKQIISVLQQEIKHEKAAQQHMTTNCQIYDDSEVPVDKKYNQFLPVYNLRAACGYFEDNIVIPENEAEGWIDISESGIKANRNMFVIYATGDSMLPKIKNGDLCVFELYSTENGGTREGEIVLTECPDKDTDTDCHYTIKKYHSTWRKDDDGNDIHDTIELIPLNTDEYETIVYRSGEKLRTVGIFKGVL